MRGFADFPILPISVASVVFVAIISGFSPPLLSIDVDSLRLA